MSVLVFYKPTPEGAEAVRAGAVQAAFHGTDLVVHNVPTDEAAAETVVALASGAAAGAVPSSARSPRQGTAARPSTTS